MSIETLDDIIEQLLDRLGIYGAHSEACTNKKLCRCCAASELNDRIMAAVEVEAGLQALRQLNLGERKNAPQHTHGVKAEATLPRTAKSEKYGIRYFVDAHRVIAGFKKAWQRRHA